MQTAWQRHRQTDGQTTCDRKTALCTVVHRAVKALHAPTGDRREEDAEKYDEGAGDVGDDVSFTAITSLVAANPVTDLRVARSKVLCSKQ